MRIAHAWQQITRDLPVTTSPSMLPHRIGVVVSRIVVEKFDIGNEGRARENRLKKVVAEKGILGHAIGQRRFEGVHIVKALARVDACAKKILVNVGGCGGVRIDAGVAGKNTGETRSRRALEGHADARLQNAVATRYAADLCVEL